MPGRLSAYAFILSGAVLFAIASAFAGAQSRPTPSAHSQMPRAAQGARDIAARDQPALRGEGQRQDHGRSSDRNRRKQ